MMRPKILLIARADDVRDDMQEYLETKDFEVVSTKTSADALSLLIVDKFDVVITDLHVRKDHDDLALLHVVRYFRPNALIVATTAFLNAREAAMALRLSIEVVVRPFSIKQVAELIEAKMPKEKSPVCAEVEQWKATHRRLLA